MSISDYIYNIVKAVRDSKTFEKETWKQRAVRWVKTFGTAARMFVAKDIWGLRVPTLTYSTMMAFIPLLAMVFAIAKGFGYYQFVVSWIGTSFASQPHVADAIVKFVDNYLAHTHDGYILGVGVVMLLITLIFLVWTVEDAFNVIWNVKRRPVFRMVADYVTLIIFFAIMIIFTSGVNGYAIAFSEQLESWTSMGWLGDMWVKVISIVLMSCFFVCLYYFIPNTYVKLRCVLFPSALAGLFLYVLQYYYFLVQVWLSSYNIIYGSFAALPLFLIWMRASWTICMFGAVLCYTNQNIHLFDNGIDEDTKLKFSVQLRVCALIMYHVCSRFKMGKARMNALELKEVIGVPQLVINRMLDKLVKAGMLTRVPDLESAPRETAFSYAPIERLAHITYGMLIERLENAGQDVDITSEELTALDNSQVLSRIDREHMEKCRAVELSDLFPLDDEPDKN